MSFGKPTLIGNLAKISSGFAGRGCGGYLWAPVTPDGRKCAPKSFGGLCTRKL
jgi:hypothetical protein